MYLRAVIFSMIILIITAYILIKDYKKKGFSFLKALIGVVIAIGFLSYPLYEEYTGISRIGCTILFAIQTLTLNEDFQLVSEVITDDLVTQIYVIFTYILYFVAPLISATALLSLFGNIFSKIRFLLNTKKEIHIFSDINEKSVNLANRLLIDRPNSKIIFANKENNSLNIKLDKRIIKLKEDVIELKSHNSSNENYIYFISDDEDQNLNKSLEYISKVSSNEKVNIYIFNDKPEAYMIVDTVMNNYYEKNSIASNEEKNVKSGEIVLRKNKSNLKVEVINETERMVYQRLNNLPIEKVFNIKSKEMNVLLVGCGMIGQAFLKAIVWCFQVVGYNLNIFVVDKNADEVIHKINLESPELLKNYYIKFINEDIETVITEDALNGIDINYAIVNAGSDTNNFNIAIALRRYFLRKNQDNVTIDISIRDEYKNKNIALLRNEDNEDYNINTFGSIKETYFYKPIIDLKQERMAQMVHSILWSDGGSLIDFYKSEYNRKSSKAVVIHIKYKLFSILKDKYTGELNQDIENYKKLIIKPEIAKLLAENEHDRWMAYMYADGYKVATMEDVEKYYFKVGKSHKNTLAKLHPLLVKNEDIKSVEKDFADLTEKLTGKRIEKNFTKLDYKVVEMLDKIIK